MNPAIGGLLVQIRTLGDGFKSHRYRHRRPPFTRGSSCFSRGIGRAAEVLDRDDLLIIDRLEVEVGFEDLPHPVPAIVSAVQNGPAARTAAFVLVTRRSGTSSEIPDRAAEEPARAVPFPLPPALPAHIWVGAPAGSCTQTLIRPPARSRSRPVRASSSSSGFPATRQLVGAAVGRAPGRARRWRDRRDPDRRRRRVPRGSRSGRPELMVPVVAPGTHPRGPSWSAVTLPLRVAAWKTYAVRA